MATVDLAFSRLRTCFGTLRFFRHGWGDPTRQHLFLSQIRSGLYTPPPPPQLTWTRLGPPSLNVHLATFRSPSASFLPPASHLARLLSVSAGPHAPVAIHLPATGDHGFWRRALATAFWLRRRGVTSIVLEGPLYGHRRPKGQTGALLRCVSDLHDLGRATIEETLALVHYFADRGVTRQAVVGTSQGGLHAAMVASLCDGLPAVMALAPHSAAPVFTDGVLASVVDWQSLAEGGCVHAARRKLRDVLSVSDIANFPRRGEGEHVLFFAKSDRYISRDCLHAWRLARPDLQVKWVGGGHVTASLSCAPGVRQAILEVLTPPRWASYTPGSAPRLPLPAPYS